MSYSASMNDLYPDKTYYVAVRHSDLVKDDTVFKLIINLINGNTELIDGVSPGPGIEM